jgi:hypothetical protein
MPSKVWESTNGGFCPVEGRIPSFEGEHRGLMWLGCRGVEYTPALDTVRILPEVEISGTLFSERESLAL